MPNSSSPLRAHSQQSLSKYSIFSSFPKMIPDAWSTDDPGGNGRLKYVETSTTNTCADPFAASSKAKVSHIIKGESKGISYHAFSLSFPLPLFSPAKTRIEKAICRNLHSNLRCHQEVRVHSNARFAFNSCIRGQILQEKMPNLHKEIPLLQREQVRQVKMIH